MKWPSPIGWSLVPDDVVPCCTLWVLYGFTSVEWVWFLLLKSCSNSIREEYLYFILPNGKGFCNVSYLKEFTTTSPPPDAVWSSADRDSASSLLPLTLHALTHLSGFPCPCRYITSRTPSQPKRNREYQLGARLFFKDHISRPNPS